MQRNLVTFFEMHDKTYRDMGLRHAPVYLEDTDFYKATMAQVYDAELPTMTMDMKFHNRTAGIDLAKYQDAVDVGLDRLCECRFQPATMDRFAQVPYFSESYVHFLRGLQLYRPHINVKTEGTDLSIRSHGPGRYVTWFETRAMDMTQEAYFTDVHANLDMREGMERLEAKCAKYVELMKMYEFTLSEFGTRRRAGYAWHDYVISTLVERFRDFPKHFLGTSNMHFAVKYNTPFVGTMAHEYLQVGQALPNVALDQSQRYMLELWHKVYRAQLGLALSDVVGNAAFLRDFDYYLANMYAGVRHDSNDPFVWAENQIRHYESLRIHPTDKVLMFSDSLNVDVCHELLKAFHGKAKLSFGIGTDWTNDLGVKPLQLVMKAVQVNGKPVAKISDSAGKGMCEDPIHEDAVRRAFKI